MFQLRNNNAQIVTTFYKHILGREPDAGGLATYTALIQKVGIAEGAETMLKAFLGSPEYAIKLPKKNNSLVDGLDIAQRKLINGKKVSHVVSLGTHCLASSILKKWNLKKYSMPFDWLFMSPSAITHCLENDFEILLDRSFYKPFVAESGQKKAEHLWYREKHKVTSVFAHRDPTGEEDYRYFARAVDRFRTLARSRESAKLFVMISDTGHDIRKNFSELSQAVRSKVSNSALICVQLAHETGLPGCSSMRQIAQDGDHALYEFTPSSTQAGLGFPEILDDLAVLRLIHQYDIELSSSI
jgi:hypothetical protein